jgi:hypothetical protein
LQNTLQSESRSLTSPDTTAQTLNDQKNLSKNRKSNRKKTPVPVSSEDQELKN